MNHTFLENTSIIKYNADTFEKKQVAASESLVLSSKNNTTNWLNTYGLEYKKEFLEIIKQNNLDDFLVKLLMEDQHPNKVIELDNVLFITIKVLKTDIDNFDSEQMLFITSADFVWSIQEKSGDYFNWIRERLESNKGISRKKNADYLLFLILESIIENYHDQYEEKSDFQDSEFTKINPTPEFTANVEKRKQNLFKFKKATIGLRDIIIKLEKTEFEDIETKYFSELKEQTNNLISDIDFEIQELESKINLIFSIQGHRLNEVMKTLTILSVIFIPLTFLAGIYGMNFKNIPELETHYGYFVLLGVMLLITILSVWYFKRKKWF
ncbi:magnesium and cobalt transport protein CorA [Flavicella marina]|uniref:magnesium and cobalt transport protein CorA n=1 Tax=Flavicella marina TaxID=1475951 RepID=UPI0012641467|nr:magnesium and cobalt transport protein CorA [Flavicella marina]